eukprot:scaffold3273_cov148-Cylindrotheca_fusiformis.AAC.13
MKLVISQFAILVMAKRAFGQSCSFCPNGITFPDHALSGTIMTCEDAAELYETDSDTICDGYKLAFAPECCPDQKEILFKDNACGWCPNGIASSDTPVVDPFDDTQTITCFEMSTYTATVPMGCSFYEPSQSTCCPGNEGEVDNGDSCNFCGDEGSEFPDLATYGNATCSELELGAILLGSGTQCDIYKSQFEPACCPSFAGEGNGGGDGGGDSGGGNGGGTNGGSCYICGSADIAMTKADSLLFGVGENDEDLTCSEIQASLNETELSCSFTLQLYNSFINLPSVCGCEGAVAPNLPECSPCNGGSAIPGATVPGETYSCAYAIELSKHFTDSEICLSGRENATDIEELQSACCLSVGDGGGNSGGGGGGDGGNSGGGGGGNSGGDGGVDGNDNSGGGRTTNYVGLLVATGLAAFSFPLF